MNQQTSTDPNASPRTAPHVAIALGIAIAVIVGLHLAGFHFVTAGQASFG